MCRKDTYMNPQELLVILHTAERLKNTPRHSWTSSGRQESVAEHSFRLAVMAYFMKDEFPALDIDRVIKMCLFHDFGEAFTGDIPAFVKNESDSERETHLINNWLSTLPSPYWEELSSLLRKWERQETAEARLYRTLEQVRGAHSARRSRYLHMAPAGIRAAIHLWDKRIGSVSLYKAVERGNRPYYTG